MKKAQLNGIIASIMPTVENIRIKIPLKITFQHDIISARQMANVLNAVNEAVYEEESTELEVLARKFPDLPPVVLDAARYRLEYTTHDAVFIESVSSGCVILTGSIALVSLYILKQTLGETIKEAWKEDEWHQKLKHYLTENLKTRVSDIANKIDRRLNQLRNVFRRERHFEIEAQTEVVIENGLLEHFK